MNLVDPEVLGPAGRSTWSPAWPRSTRSDGAELVGLLPESVLTPVDEQRWAELDLSAERTIEARLARRASRRWRRSRRGGDAQAVTLMR